MKIRRCGFKHKPKIEKCDLSKISNQKGADKMFQVRCDVPTGTCEFSEYYFNKDDAIRGWNIRELL